jgi:AbrB family looped-hinge helix DNA binding protein
VVNYSPLVKKMEYIKVDKQGRITIPSQIRNSLSLSENSVLEIAVQANEIILRKSTPSDSKEIDEWFEFMKSAPTPRAKNDVLIDESKYYSEDYVKQKLGIEE